MRRSIAVMLVAASLFGVGSPASGEPSGRTGGRGGERYVALGDSAAAGPIILPQQGGPRVCLRSARNFPTLAAAGLGVGSFKDVTCSSAVIANLWSAQSGAPPQLDALEKSTTLVTLGPIGANDAGLFDVALRCLVPGCAQRDGRTVHRRIEATRPKLRAALRAIRTRAPRAAVVVVGYGRYLPASACPLALPFTRRDGNYVQGLVDHMSRVLRQTARSHGATFADLRATPGALKHTVCAAPGRRWFEGLVPLGLDGAVPLHPTAIGMEAFSATVRDAVERARAKRADFRGDQASSTRSRITAVSPMSRPSERRTAFFTGSA